MGDHLPSTATVVLAFGEREKEKKRKREKMTERKREREKERKGEREKRGKGKREKKKDKKRKREKLACGSDLPATSCLRLPVI